MLRLVPLHHMRTDLRFREFAHGLSEEVLLCRGTKVHHAEMYKGKRTRDKGKSPASTKKCDRRQQSDYALQICARESCRCLCWFCLSPSSTRPQRLRISLPFSARTRRPVQGPSQDLRRAWAC